MKVHDGWEKRFKKSEEKEEGVSLMMGGSGGLKLVVGICGTIDIGGLRFAPWGDGLSPVSEKAKEFLKNIRHLTIERELFTTTRTSLPFKNIDGCEVSVFATKKAFWDYEKITTPDIFLEILIPKSFFNKNADCRNCKYINQENDKICYAPERLGLSEVKNIFSNLRAWCQLWEVSQE